MKTNHTHTERTISLGLPLMTLAMGLAFLPALTPVPLQAQSYDSGNIPKGYNEDEWYDPGDWFDGDNIEVNGNDYDWWDQRGWTDSYDSIPTSSTNTTNTRDNTNNTNTTNTRDNDPYIYRFYYWDPIIVGWNTTDSGKSNSTQRNTADQRNSQSNQATTFDGTVSGFKRLMLQDNEGRSGQHTFVRVQLKNGESRVISLGSNVNLADLNLRKGDEIRVTGNNVRMNNRNVLAASRIKVDERTFQIDKNNQIDANRNVEVQGTVKAFSRTSLGNDATKQNLLLRLELQNGKQCVVDLGEGTRMQDLDLMRGSTINIEGRKSKIDGKSLIVANRVRVDGETTNLRRQSTLNGESTTRTSNTDYQRDAAGTSNTNYQRDAAGTSNTDNQRDAAATSNRADSTSVNTQENVNADNSR